MKEITDAFNSNQVQTFTYDHRNRLTTASTNGVGDGTYSDTYSYNTIGNIDTFDGAVYVYDAIHKHAVAGMAFPSFSPHASFTYDGNGNMTSRTVSGTTYTQNWDVENRLTTVTSGSNTTRFYYDANGQRMITAHPDGQVVYTPFPGYEEELPLSHSLTANGQTSLTIAPNTAFTLAWDSQGATGCMASGNWSGSKDADGSQTISGFASGSRTYTLVCSNGSSATSSQSVTVTVPPAPTLTLTGNGQEQVLYVTANQNFTLAWSSSGATSCTASGNWSGQKATSGSQSITGFASGSRTYTLTCTNGYTPSSKSVVVTAYNLPALNFTVNFSSSNLTVQPGTTYTLRWSAAAVSSCTAGGSWSGNKAVAGVQSYTAGSGGSSYTYTLSCGSGGDEGVYGALTVTVEVCQECLGGEEPGKPETVQPALETPLVYTQPTVSTLPATGQPLSPNRQPDGNDAPQTMGVENTSAIIRLTYAFGGQAVATRIINGSSTLYYIHNDHLGSNSRMSTSAGSAVAGSTSRYTPFGDWRTEPTATLTDRGYTGHLHNNLGSGSDDLGLIYMNARYYLPSSGRFISPDTLVPDKANPQSLNRYSYVANNPLLLVDESGHCWGFASGIRDWNFTIGGTTYGGGVNCANIDMALSIVQNPEATPTEKAQAGVYLGGWVVAGVSGTAGGGLLVCSAVAPCAAAAETAVGLGTYASADGNPTNEIQAAANAGSNIVSTVNQKVVQIWDRINATQPARSGTQIPKSFVLDNPNGKFWVHPNATKHMAEFLNRGPAGQTSAANQLLLESFDEAVTFATNNGTIAFNRFNQLITTVNGWELKFVQRANDLYPVINHAVYTPN